MHINSSSSLPKSYKPLAPQAPLVAVLDSGVDLSHPDLEPYLWTNPNPGGTPGFKDDLRGYSPAFRSGPPQDRGGHGTHVAGIVVSQAQSQDQVQAQILPIQWIARMGSSEDLLKGMQYAELQGARIACHSHGSPLWSREELDFIKHSKMLHICAAGNDAKDTDFSPHFPSCHDLPNVISVANLDDQGQLAPLSNFGFHSVDLGAPGQEIDSTWINGQHKRLSGTSMACPHVVGAAARIVAEYPDISNEEIKARLLYNVEVLPNLAGKVHSSGRVDVEKALQPDPIPPGPAQQAQVVEVDFDRARLQWSASSDDGLDSLQAAQQFYLRLSSQPITAENWKEADLVGQGRPAGVGAEICSQIELPLSSSPQRLFAAIALEDKVGNLSDPICLGLQQPASRRLEQKEAWSPQGNWSQQEDRWRGSQLEEGETLTSGIIDLQGSQRPVLEFAATFEEAQVVVEGKDPGQDQWKPLKTLRGSSWGDQRQRVELSSLPAGPTQLRFRSLAPCAVLELGALEVFDQMN